jgi:Tfp pilus assembly PilM family ATPase
MTLRRKKGWIGIDLGTRALKVAQVERSGPHLRLAACVVLPRAYASRDGDAEGASGCDWLGRDILAALSLEAGFSGRTAACVLPMGFTDLHCLSIPPGEAGERRAMVAHELASLFSAEKRKREFDFWETESAATAGAPAKENMNVLSVPRGLVSRVVRSLCDARLTCEVIDGLPFALARAVQLVSVPGSGPPVGAIDWGFTSGTFCIVSDGRPLFTRHLRSCGFGSLTDAVSRALNVSENEAMQLLAEHGLPDPDSRHPGREELQKVIAEIAAQPLNELAEELKKTISFVQMQYPRLLPERLYLLGDGAVVNNLTVLLLRKVGIPVQTWRLPVGDGGTANRSRILPAVLGAAAAVSALAWER